jgi:hypothetical protein
MEGIDSLFSVATRRARRYRTAEHMAAMLYFVTGKLSLLSY